MSQLDTALTQSLRSAVEAIPMEQARMLTYASLARRIDVPTTDPRFVPAIEALVADGVLARGWTLFDADDREHEIDEAEAVEALRDGEIVHPASGEMVPVTERNLKPHWFRPEPAAATSPATPAVAKGTGAEMDAVVSRRLVIADQGGRELFSLNSGERTPEQFLELVRQYAIHPRQRDPDQRRVLTVVREAWNGQVWRQDAEEFLRCNGVEMPGPGPSDAECLAALSADTSCIQGYQYRHAFVIRDMRRPVDDQEIWTGPLNDRAAYLRQLEIEQMRVTLAAAKDAAAKMAQTSQAA